MKSREQRHHRTNMLLNGFRELRKVASQVGNMPVLKRYLFSFFLYSVGVQTVMLVAAAFAKKEIFPDPKDEAKLLITIILIQLIAIPGAIFMSRLSKRIGNFNVLIWAVIVWIAICITAYYINTQTQLYILACIIGLVMGGIQSMSRSTYSKLLPVTEDTTSFFSFYDVTEKLALFLGLFIFGGIEQGTGNIRNSLWALMFAFFLGFLALLWTKRAAKQEGNATIHD
jgi:MFS transporter, UMF1 family